MVQQSAQKDAAPPRSMSCWNALKDWSAWCRPSSDAPTIALRSGDASVLTGRDLSSDVSASADSPFAVTQE